MYDQRIAPDDLTTFAEQILTAAGTPPRHAAAVADHLVQANLAGHDSHGVIRLGEYVSDIETARLDPRAEPSTSMRSTSTAVVDGVWGYGQVAAEAAVTVGIAMTETTPVAIVGITRCHHLGRLGAYAEQVARADRILISAAGGHTPIAAVHGSRSRTLGANPIAIGFPTSATHFITDFATTEVAAGKVKVAAANSVNLASRSIITAGGELTDHPEAFAEGGALISFGGHKGSALAIVAELLTAGLVGPVADPDAPETAFARQSALFIVLRTDIFAPTETVRAAAAAVLGTVAEAVPIHSDHPVMYPGEPEETTRQLRRSGVPVDDGTRQQLRRLADHLRVDTTWLDPPKPSQ